MRTLKKEFLIAVLTLFCLGMLNSRSMAIAGKPQKSSKTPTYYEMYVTQGPKTLSVPKADLTFKTAFSWGPDKSGLYGIPAQPQTRLDIEPMTITIFDPETAGATMRLAKLAYIETMPANSFDLNPAKVSPAIFNKVYHVNYDEPVPINLWCVENDIPLHITPVANKPGWYSAVPEHKLEAGVYAINFGCADGPRIYTGDLYFFPFILAKAPEPPVCQPVRRSKRRRAPKPTPVLACPPAPKAHPLTPVPLSAASQLDAGFNYVVVSSPEGRREYRITNTNDIPLHNVNISVFMRDSRFPATVLGPVTLYKDIVLPEQTVSQTPDKTSLQYETLSDEGAKLYLKIKCKEGVIKKAWQKLNKGESGPADLVEVPWDLKE